MRLCRYIGRVALRQMQTRVIWKLNLSNTGVYSSIMQLMLIYCSLYSPYRKVLWQCQGMMMVSYGSYITHNTEMYVFAYFCKVINDGTYPKHECHSFFFFLAFGEFIFVNSSYKSFCMDMKKYSGTRKT